MTADVPPGTLESLLAEREWVRALARSLVADPGLADDVEQETWLAATQRPPGDVSSPRAWLGTVVRNFVRRAGRGAGRRRLREAAAARPEAMPSAADMVAHAEAHRRVVGAVLALDEPYRSAVLARFFEDMPPREIAARMGVPVETVRSRLKRGLASLRVRLDAEYGGDGNAWGIALLPLAAMKGGLIVKGTTKAAIAVAALLLVAGTVAVVWTSSGDGGGARSGAGLAAVAPSPVIGTTGHAASTVAAAAPSPVAAGTAEVRGEVWFASPSKPAPGIDVVVGSDPKTARTVKTDESGRFVAAALPEGFRGRVVVRAEKCATVVRPLMPLRAGERRDAGLFMLSAAASVRFVVADFDGNPVEGAAIEGRRTEMGGWHDPRLVSDAWRDVREPECSATTDATGRAALDDVEPSEWTFVARKSGFADASIRDVRLRAGTAPVTVKLHLFPGLKLAGRVLDRERKGVGGVIVWAEARFAANRYSDAVTPHAVSAADGAYAFDDLLDGEYTIRVSRPGTPLVGAGNVRLPTTAPFDVVLAGRRVTGTVRDADGGTPIAGAVVRGECDGTIEATSGADGAYVLDTVVDAWAVYNLRVAKPGWYQAQDGAPKSRNPQFGDPPTVLDDAKPSVRDFNMRRGVKLSGRVLCQGEPVRGARVMFSREGALGRFTDTAADADGRYMFDGVAPGTLFLMSWSPGWGFARAGGSSGFTPGQPYGDRVVVTEKDDAVLDLAMEPAGEAPAPATVHVKGTVTAPASGPRAAFVQVGHAYELTAVRNGTVAWLAIPRSPVGSDGSFDVEVSAYPDAISVRAGADGCAPSTVKATEVSGSPGVFEAHVQLATAGRIAGRAVGEETNAPIAGADVILDVDERHGWSMGEGRPNVEVVVARTDADGRFTIEGVSTGAHQVEIVVDGRLPARREVETSAETETEFRLPPMHSIAGVVTYADGRPAPMLSIDATFDEASTNGWKTIGVAQTRSDGTFAVGYIPAGTYKLLVTDGLSQAGIQRVELHSIAADTKDLRITVGDALAIRGRVVDPDGKPVADANVEAWPETGHAYGSGTTRQDGTFEMTGLESQPYKVRAHAPRAMDYSGVTIGGRLLGASVLGVRPPRDDVSVTLVLGRTIEGVALDETGAPLKLRVIRADRIAYEDRDAVVDVIVNPGAITDDAGHFEIGGLPPGTWRLVALGLAPKPEPQPLVGGERVAAGTRGLRVTLGRYATITGVVVGEDDKPIAKAEVRAFAPDGSEASSATTDADGAFTLKRLDTGVAYDLHASADGRAPAKAAGVAAGTASVRLRPTAGLRSTGRLLDAQGVPVKDTSLTFAADASPVKARAKTDADGRFEVLGLLPGTYRAEWLGVKDNRSGRWPCGTFEAGATDVELRAE